MSKKKQDWNAVLEQTLSKLKSGEAATGKNGALTGLIKEVIETSLDAEMDNHLSENRPNRRNGKGKKQLKTAYGKVDLETNRDRDGTFEPEIVGKRQRSLGEGVDEHIISLFGLGLSYSDIRHHVAEIYGLEISSGLITGITDKLLPKIEDWQTRPLDAVYPFIYLDGMYFKGRNDKGQVVKKVAYSILGVDLEGQKEILGIYIFEGGESAKKWMQVLSEIQQRGVEDIMVACIDNLSGFREAITGIFEDTKVQLCIIHQIRNSTKYISWKEVRVVLADLKKVYQAPSQQAAAAQLDCFEQQWGKQYPAVVKSWRKNWEGISECFSYPAPIRKMIYTTNIIEGYHRNVRKRTKTKGSFTSDNAIMKLLYLVQKEMAQKWGTVQGWPQILQQLEILFGERIEKHV